MPANDDGAKFFRELRAGLRKGSIFEPRVCTRDAPDMGARRHEGVTRVGVVDQPDGEHVQYRCADCGAVWDV